MMYWGFREKAPCPLQFEDELDADDAAGRGQLHLLNCLPPDEPKITVNVTDRKAEKKMGKLVVDRAHHLAMLCVRAFYLIAINNVNLICEERVEIQELAHVILPVAVRIEHEILTGVFEARSERPSVSTVGCVVDNSYARQGLG
jgi:hypothetical protein